MPEPRYKSSPLDPKPKKCTQLYWYCKLIKQVSPSVQMVPRPSYHMGQRRGSQCCAMTQTCASVPEHLPRSHQGPQALPHTSNATGLGGNRTFTGEDAQDPARGRGLCKAPHPGDGRDRRRPGALMLTQCSFLWSLVGARGPLWVLLVTRGLVVFTG